MEKGQETMAEHEQENKHEQEQEYEHVQEQEHEQEREQDQQQQQQPAIEWHSPAEEPFRLTGFPWFGQDRVYRRLPVKPEYPIRPEVDWLANHTAGGQIAFQTDSRQIWVKARLRAPADMNHMPATGQCGFDLYLGRPGEQRFYGVTKYDLKATSYEYKLLEAGSAAGAGLRAGATDLKAVTLNFPLYQGVEEVSIGLDAGAQALPFPPYAYSGRLIFYGTSITQGGCASRPGMAYTNILSRRLNIETVNLGFSGNGKGDPELAKLIAQIPNPRLLVLDYEPNCVSTELLRETLPQFIRIYREAHPLVPILVVSRIPFSHDLVHQDVLQARKERGEFQRQTVQVFRSRGDANIFFYDGSTLLGDDFDECTVDGIHPTDLGFLRIANGLEPVLRGILGAPIPGAPRSARSS